MKLTVENLFVLLANLAVDDELLKPDATFEEIFNAAVGWSDPRELSIECHGGIFTVWIGNCIEISKLRDGSLFMTASWPMGAPRFEEEKDLYMTALVLMLWKVQPEYDEREKAKGRLGRGILLFDFDLEGFESNLYRIGSYLKKKGIKTEVVRKIARRFSAWSEKEMEKIPVVNSHKPG